MTATEQQQTWTIGRLLDWTSRYLAEKGSEFPRLDTEVLLAYALDQGVEVKTFEGQSTGPRLTVRMLQSELQVQYTLRKTRTYLLRNRSKSDRMWCTEASSRRSFET